METQDTLRAAPQPAALRAPSPTSLPRRLEVAPTSVPIVSSELEMSRRGLRFVRPETEEAFREWHVAGSVPFARNAMIVALSIWTSVTMSASLVMAPEDFLWVLSAFGITTLVNVTALVVAFRERLRRWVASSQVIANAMNGFIGVVLSFQIGLPEGALVASISAAFVGGALQRLRVPQAAVAVLGYVALNQVLIVDAFMHDRLAPLNLALYSIGPFNAFLGGMLACVAAERVSRQTYRQEQVIAAQRETIERERARANIAERARDLSEALLRLSGAPQRASAFAVGDVVENRYRVLGPIGRGGMGQVYEVERLDDRHRFALKVMTGTAERSALARFAREAQLAAELAHPNVVAAVDVGVTQSGTLFLVMELVTGQSLSAARSRYGDAGWAVPILHDVCEALSAMHSRGIVHRDLKPANILLAGDSAKVTDFGLATIVSAVATQVIGDEDTAADGAQLTQTGAVMGTPMYMAPELAEGARDAGTESDVFSFGVVAFELLAGRLPFSVPPISDLMNGRTPAPYLSLSDVRPELPTDVRVMVDRCLLQPNERPNAALLAQTFDDVRRACLPPVAAKSSIATV